MNRVLNIIFLITICMVYADNRYGGVWTEGTGSQVVVYGSDWTSFVNQWELHSSNNLRLVDLEVYNDADSGLLKFAGIFRPGTFGHYLYAGFTWAQFTSKWSELAQQGYRLVNVETYVEGGVRKYAGVWHSGTDSYYLWNANWSSFVDKWNELSQLNMRLVDVETYVSNGVVYYIGVWRSGTGGHYLWNADWTSFTAKWNELASQRLKVFKTYTDGSGKRMFLGVWRSGSGGYYLWSGVDKENFDATVQDLYASNLRLVGLNVYPGPCSSQCTNLISCKCSYNYRLTGDSIYYRNPVKGATRYAKLSPLYGSSQIFKLPFSDSSVKRVNGWLYSANSWHHAVDYAIDGKTAFAIKAAAAGVVVYVGWDNWSGNSIVIKHNSAEGSDTYRTIYMHLRNGPSNDCNFAWNSTIPTLTGDTKTKYSDHLIASGCKQNPAQRNLNADHWGTNSQNIKVVVGQSVAQGQIIGYSGQTGPGGSLGGGGGSNTNNHLHIFFTHKDPEDGNFYFVDPYGIYGVPSCYPSAIVGPYSSSDNTCVRYPILFRNGYPQYS